MAQLEQPIPLLSWHPNQTFTVMSLVLVQQVNFVSFLEIHQSRLKTAVYRLLQSFSSGDCRTSKVRSLKLSQSLMEALTGLGFFSALGSVVRNLRLVHRICGSGTRIWKDDGLVLSGTVDKVFSGTFPVSMWKAGLVVPAFHILGMTEPPTEHTNSFIIMPNCSFMVLTYLPQARIDYDTQLTSWTAHTNTVLKSIPSHSIFLFNWD